MRPIGGEIEFPKLSENIYFADSGRSSLKLFLRSGFNSKKILLPNYFCEIIEQILIDENIEYEFYNILDNLTIDFESIENKQYDILYIINYFGMTHNIDKLAIDNKIIIEDNVFFNDFSNTKNYKYWFGFNSFRKISSLSDGSLIKTNLKINNDLIINQEAKFVQPKNIAKDLKYQYIYNNIGEESDYLNKFIEGESLINLQKNIYTISNKSLYYLFAKDTFNNQDILKKRYERLYKEFKEYSLNLKITYYSFFILKLSNVDKLKKELSTKQIYLPIHWPKSTQYNDLYGRLISIPLFINYDDVEFNNMIDIIKENLDIISKK